MKRFNQEQFLEALTQAPWDAAFVFQEIDDVLNGWEQIFNSVADSYCPWREKRIKKSQQAPWITKPVIISYA